MDVNFFVAVISINDVEPLVVRNYMHDFTLLPINLK